METSTNPKRLGQSKKIFTIAGENYLLKDLDKAALPANVLAFVHSYLNGETITVLTSGSTGKPQPIHHSTSYMRASAISTLQFLGLQPGATCLLCLSPEYIAGMMMLVRWIEGDLDLYYTEPDNQPLLYFDRDFDLVAMVPYQVFHSYDHLHKVNNLLVGGGVISLSLESRLRGVKGHVYQSYGMTETITHIALRQINPHFQQVYQALPGVTLAADERSCLVINAPAIGVNELLTNDVVDLINEREFRWLGRYDNVVNSGGIKLYPEELERELGDFGLAYIFGSIPDAALGEKLVMVFEAENAGVPELLMKHLQRLSKYHRPKEIRNLPSFSRTDTGKVRRSIILKQAFPEY